MREAPEQLALHLDHEAVADQLDPRGVEHPGRTGHRDGGGVAVDRADLDVCHWDLDLEPHRPWRVELLVDHVLAPAGWGGRGWRN